ncbi:MAG: alpha amylase C-terminal domain-containing protein, partial [Gammaproteobacteria bacterium]|nr:alpha amylase C-terminal domain-containing protein [Gammaproteobacteria bacterium]
LHAYDFDVQGFQWVSCDDVNNSVLAFIRRSDHEAVICVFNFTPTTLQNYTIGVPEAGTYKEIFNSDTAWYGGSDVSNSGKMESIEQKEHGFDHALTITIPPLAGIFIQKEKV